jgi:hypothetical protein
MYYKKKFDNISLFHPSKVPRPGGKPSKRWQAIVGDTEEEKKILSTRELMGPEVPLYFGSTREHQKSKGVSPLFNNRPGRRSCITRLSPQSPFLNALVPLGSSPSAVNNQRLHRCTFITEYLLKVEGFGSFHCREVGFIAFSVSM